MKQNNKNHSALDDILSPPTRDVRVFMRQAGEGSGEEDDSRELNQRCTKTEKPVTYSTTTIGR